ncbi:hypothetical protein [Terrabacter sp. Root181]|uniref:hypothetical protein n=1 Tax=Terrabacter sp. Root181 TaxID=1736484 RepID=UPI0012FBC226|nr:hypothetical protein [Terrabacter sp. Root181]
MTSFLFQAGGAVTVVFGAVRSILTAALCALVELPALSVAVVLAVSAEPSPVIVLLAGLVVPDSASAAVQATATSPLYQPAAFAFVVGFPDNVGATLSMLIPLTVVVAVLSALSVAVPVTDWSATLPLSVVGAEEDLTPDVASLGVKVTVTSVLFQPLAFAAGVREPAMIGALLSSLTWTEPVPVLVTLSVTAVVLVTMPSAVTVSVVGVTVLTPEPASVPTHVTETSDLFQPAAFGTGTSVAVAVGTVLSRTYEALPLLTPPLQEFALLPLPTVRLAVWSPSPAPDWVAKTKGLDPLVCLPVIVPVTSTHFVWLSALTVSVNAAPCLANRVPFAAVNVPAPPLKAALVTEAA